jgi:Holliday junction resolvase-like predicted endonuclease
MRIVIEKIAQDATEADIRAALSTFAEVEEITLVTQCNQLLAIIEVKMTRTQAQALASRINERIYKGHRLNAWVPLFND